MLQLYKKLFLVLFYFFILSLLKYDSLVNECKTIHRNKTFLNENVSNQTNSTKLKHTNLTNSSGTSRIKQKVSNNESTIEIDLFLELIRGQMIRLLKYLNRYDVHNENEARAPINHSSFEKTNRIISTHEEDELQIEKESEERLNVSLSNIIHESFMHDKEQESLENELHVDLNEKLTSKNDLDSSHETLIARTDYINISSTKFTPETNDVIDTTTVSIDLTVTKTSNKISTTLSIPYQENPYFMQCVNTCGSDHECIRQKCLLDSTYFG